MASEGFITPNSIANIMMWRTHQFHLLGRQFYFDEFISNCIENDQSFNRKIVSFRGKVMIAQHLKNMLLRDRRGTF